MSRPNKPASFEVTIDYDARNETVYVSEYGSSGYKETARTKKEILSVISGYIDSLSMRD